VQSELTRSFSSAANTAQRYPQYADQIITAARAAFLRGDRWAYLAGILAVVLGGALVFIFFPKFREEQRLLAEYHQEDTAGIPAGSDRGRSGARRRG
jgi:MFS transporter, DHA2 family, multidrug resistance protein